MRLLLLTVLLSPGLTPLSAQVLRLPAAADATTSSDQPSTKFGKSPELNPGKHYVRQPTSKTWFQRAYLRFDLSKITQAPDRARLFWYQSKASGAGCLDANLHRVTQPWTEAAIDWNSQAMHDSTATSTACIGNSFENGWKSFDVTALVQGWVKKTWPNHGLVIRDPRESLAGAARPGFGHSRESTMVLLRPYLELSTGIAIYGTGCGPSRTLPTLDLTRGEPKVGSQYEITGIELARSAPTLLFFGFSDKRWGALPLPFDMSAIGRSGCRLLASGELIFSAVSTSSSTAAFTLTLPNDPRVRGLNLYHQLLSVDATRTPDVFYMTNALRVTGF